MDTGLLWKGKNTVKHILLFKKIIRIQYSYKDGENELCSNVCTTTVIPFLMQWHIVLLCVHERKSLIVLLFYFILTFTLYLVLSVYLMLMHAHVESHRLDLLTMVLIGYIHCGLIRCVHSGAVSSIRLWQTNYSHDTSFQSFVYPIANYAATILSYQI